MLQFFSNLFDSVTVGASGQRRRKEVDREVDDIESHLDENFPFWRLQSAPYNLIDWDVTASGAMSGPIYLGSALALMDDHFLRQVGAVLTIIDPGRCPKEAVQKYLGPSKSLMYLPLDDDPREDISKYFDRSAEFLKHHQQRGVPILVHCMAGMSRSSTLLANYLMKKYNISAMSVLDVMKKRRPIVRPNSGFIHQLVLQQEE